MATIAMLIGGAVVNALAFSGSNYVFSTMNKSNAAQVEAEREMHDKALEQLETAQTEWNQKRTARLDFINDALRRQNYAVQIFNDVDTAICEYSLMTGHELDTIGPKPTLSEFYTPSNNQKSREITFSVLGLTATAHISYEIAKYYK